jgi:hypothetical protein
MRRVIFSLVATMLAAPLAQAQINYNFLEATLTGNRIDTTGDMTEDGVGAGFRGSFEVMPYLQVFGSLQYADYSDLNVETTLTQLGVGTHYDFSDTKSVFLNVGALSADVETTVSGLGSISADDDGYGISVGYREVNDTPLEFRLAIDYVTFNDSNESDTSVDISLQYRISRGFKILGGYQFGGDEDMLRLGIRYYFDRSL